MKKLIYLLCLAFISFGIASCEDNKPGDDNKNNQTQNDPNNPNNNDSNNNGNGTNVGADGNFEPEAEVLTPAKQKEKISKVGDDFVAQFNSTDFSSLLKLIDECSHKFEDYEWDAYEDNILDEEIFIGKLSNIVTEAQAGMPVNMDAYIFAMDRISAKYEANDKTQSWTVTETNDGKLTIIFTNLSGEKCEIIVSTSAESYDLTSYYEDYEYNSYEDKSTTTAQPFQVIVPESINITIKEGDYEHMNATCNINLEKNKLFNLEWTAQIASLKFYVKADINNKSAEATYSISQHNQNLLTMTAAAPSCSLLGKKDSDSMEEWINEYYEAFENQKTIFGNLTTVCNVMNRIQVIGSCNDPMSIISDFDELYDEYDYDERQFNIKASEVLNDAMNFNLYYSSDVKQASLKWDVTSREREYYDYVCEEKYDSYYDYWYEDCEEVYTTKTVYDYSPVIYFPAENTTYSFEEYFTSDIYSGLLEQVEDLCNSYVKMLKYIDVDPVDFDDL